jgi:hypothetical protein
VIPEPTTREDAASASVSVSENKLEIKYPRGHSLSCERVPLPQAFLEWQSQARLRMFQLLSQAGSGAIHSQPAHLPVLATLGEGDFPINLATRGIGLLPKSDSIGMYIRLFTSAIKEGDRDRWNVSLPARVDAMRQFYEHIENVDPMILGGLEIFEGRTLANMRNNPLVSLLYTGEPPKYPSFQFNCVMEFLYGDDPRFKFLLAARELFAFEAFHITQKKYPWGYAFHLVEVIEKTPYPRG